MSLNPGGAANYTWNYTNPDKDEYSLEIVGTVVSLQEVQAREYNMGGNRPGRPRFWPDGNPIMNIRMGIATPEGKLKSITFSKAGKKQLSGEKPSLHMSLFELSGGNMMNLIGKTVHMWTWPANIETGQPWGQGNPRLFGVEEVPDAKYELAMPLPHEFSVPQLLADDGASGGRPVQQQYQQPVPTPPQQMQVPPQMHGQFYAAPQAQPYGYQQQPMQQQYQYPYSQQQPAQFAPRQQQPMPQQQPMQAYPPMQSAPMPNGMDPAVAAAMQAVGAVNVQPVYDDDIPF